MKDLRAALVVCRCPVGEIAENLQCILLLLGDKAQKLVLFYLRESF